MLARRTMTAARSASRSWFSGFQDPTSQTVENRSARIGANGSDRNAVDCVWNERFECDTFAGRRSLDKRRILISICPAFPDSEGFHGNFHFFLTFCFADNFPYLLRNLQKLNEVVKTRLKLKGRKFITGLGMQIFVNL